MFQGEEGELLADAGSWNQGVAMTRGTAPSQRGVANVAHTSVTLGQGPLDSWTVLIATSWPFTLPAARGVNGAPILFKSGSAPRGFQLKRDQLTAV